MLDGGKKPPPPNGGNTLPPDNSPTGILRFKSATKSLPAPLSGVGK